MKPQVTKLSQFFHEDEAAKKVLKWLREYQRSRQTTDLRQFHDAATKAGINLTLDDVVNTFERLDKLGLGSLIEGRGDKPHRFEWDYKVTSVVESVECQDKKKLVRYRRRKIPTAKTLDSVATHLKRLAEMSEGLSDELVNSFLPMRQGGLMEPPFMINQHQAEKLKKLLEFCTR